MRDAFAIKYAIFLDRPEAERGSMNLNSMLQNILDPAVLFFFFGVFSAAVRSNLEIPAAISKFFSLYLLLSVGFKGGVSMGEAGFSANVAIV